MKLHAFLMTLLSAGLLAVPASGQTLYITDGDASLLQAINVSTGSILFDAPTHFIGYPIAVRNTIWIGQRDNEGDSREYTLSGTFTGNSTTLAGTNFGNFVDGAVNGSTNYTMVAFVDGTSTVFSAQPNWQNATSLFNTTNGTQWVGITYDAVLNRLWLMDEFSFRRYTLAGVEEASFPHTADRGSIAWEPSSNTLWLVPNDGTAPLEHYATNGQFLGSLTTPQRLDNAWGAEFAIAAVPEPTSLALLAVGGLTAAGVWRWRRRNGNR